MGGGFKVKKLILLLAALSIGLAGCGGSPSSGSGSGAPPSAYTGNFNISGMWQSGNGTLISFGSNGVVTPTLFGFDGGPNGTYQLSGKRDENGLFTLQASHITGGNIIYKVKTLSKDKMELDAVGESYFSAAHYTLTRQ
jgi:hypothetical protein